MYGRAADYSKLSFTALKQNARYAMLRVLTLFESLQAIFMLLSAVKELWSIDPLLGKDLEANNETTAVAMERRRKYASTTIELLLETVLSTHSMQRSYFEDNWGDPLVVTCRLRV
jgi:hypothetical protein